MKISKGNLHSGKATVVYTLQIDTAIKGTFNGLHYAIYRYLASSQNYPCRLSSLLFRVVLLCEWGLTHWYMLLLVASKIYCFNEGRLSTNGTMN